MCIRDRTDLEWRILLFLFKVCLSYDLDKHAHGLLDLVLINREFSQYSILLRLESFLVIDVAEAEHLLAVENLKAQVHAMLLNELLDAQIIDAVVGTVIRHLLVATGDQVLDE